MLQNDGPSVFVHTDRIVVAYEGREEELEIPGKLSVNTIVATACAHFALPAEKDRW